MVILRSQDNPQTPTLKLFAQASLPFLGKFWFRDKASFGFTTQTPWVIMRSTPSESDLSDLINEFYLFSRAPAAPLQMFMSSLNFC